MPRQPLPPGAHGTIKAYKIGPGTWEARCKYRGLDGIITRPSRRGPTAPQARTALQRHLTQLTTSRARGEVTRDSLFRAVAALWLERDVEAEVAEGVTSPGTQRTYTSTLNNQVLPRVGALRMREVTVDVVEGLVHDVRMAKSTASASLVRTILSLVCGYAVRRGALDHNPVRSAKRQKRRPDEHRTVTVLTPEQIETMLRGVAAYAAQRQVDSRGRRVGSRALVWTDLPELLTGMLATGGRIGEALALTGADVDRDAAGRMVVRLDAHIIRVTGRGLVRVAGRKGGEPGVTLVLPDWAHGLFARRKLASGSGPLWACAEGTWLDPSNTNSRLKAALKSSDLGWVTSHVLRHTVASQLDAAGISIDDIADWLGNSKQVAKRHYVQRRGNRPEHASALDVIGKSVGKVSDTA